MAELSEAEAARLERAARTRRNARGRRQPAILPPRLARTSCFVPRRHGLSDDPAFSKVYVVRPHAVVEVRGRELGTRHRDALVALFRLRARRYETLSPDGRQGAALYRTDTTWRQVLAASGLTEHVNNLLVALRVLEELRSVTVRVYTGTFDQYEAASRSGRMPGAGWSDGLIGSIAWSGVSLDSEVTVTYGEWVRRSFETKELASVNADVYFRLKGDFARAWWPFLDSQPEHRWVSAERLGELAGRDPGAETPRSRARFREEIAGAFADMVRAGGLASWRWETVGSGRARSHRIHYVHALPRQADLLDGVAS